MRIGVSIFLMVVGAVLAFAIHATLAGVDLQVIGWILMLAGAAGLVLFFVLWNRRRATRTVVTERPSYPDTHQPSA